MLESTRNKCMEIANYLLRNTDFTTVFAIIAPHFTNINCR
jgi:hypothetical protein